MGVRSSKCRRRRASSGDRPLTAVTSARPASLVRCTLLEPLPPTFPPVLPLPPDSPPPLVLPLPLPVALTARTPSIWSPLRSPYVRTWPAVSGTSVADRRYPAVRR